MMELLAQKLPAIVRIIRYEDMKNLRKPVLDLSDIVC
jgi:hypothetical protein